MTEFTLFSIMFVSVFAHDVPSAHVIAICALLEQSTIALQNWLDTLLDTC